MNHIRSLRVDLSADGIVNARVKNVTAWQLGGKAHLVDVNAIQIVPFIGPPGVPVADREDRALDALADQAAIRMIG